MAEGSAQSLVRRWREFLAQEPDLPLHRADAISQRLTEETAALLAAGGEDRGVLLDAYAGDDDLGAAIGSALLPPPARAVRDHEALRGHPEVGFGPAELPLRTSLSLPVAEMLVDHEGFRAEPLAWTGSWFAGLPAVALGHREEHSWPVRSDGAPLTHVVQVDLAAESANQGLEELGGTGLPDDGVLQVFHDLETYGDDEDADPSGWAVRWITTFMPDELTIADAPPGLSVLPAVPINAQTNLTAPDLPEDLRRRWRDEDVQRYDRVRDWLELSAAEANMMATGPGTELTPWHDGFVPPPHVSRAAGFPATAITDRLRSVLDARLPLAGADEHVLLIDVNPLQLDRHVPASEHWFHGGHHLEVWIRAGDLAARRFDSCWAFIRTG